MVIIKPLAVWFALTVAAGVFAQETPVPPTDTVPTAPAIVPAQTTVAILPVINKAGEKKETDRVKQSEAARVQIAKMFTERGFILADPAVVTAAIKSQEVDLEDEEQHNRATLYRIGEAVKARLIVFAVITDTDLNTKAGFWTAQKQGKGKVKVWLLDTEAKKALISATITEGKSERAALPGTKGQPRVEAAISNAVRDSLKATLEAYPVITKPQK